MNRLIRLGVAALALVAGSAQVHAAAYSDVLQKLSDQIDGFLVSQGKNLAFVEDVKAPRSASGVGLKKDLIDALTTSFKRTQQNSLVEKKAQAAAAIEFSLEVNEESSELIVVAQVLDAKLNSELSEFKSGKIGDTADVSRLLNLTLDQRVDGDTKAARSPADEAAVAEAKTDRLEAALKAQTVSVVNNVESAASEKSPYRIEIRTRDADGKYTVSQPVRTEKDSFGSEFGFVNLPLGTEFAVRVINDQTDHDVSVELLLDGVNSLELCTDAQIKADGRWEFGKGKRGVVKGWLTDADKGEFRAFETSSLADGLITQLKRKDLDNVGTITARFFPAWPEGENPPAVEAGNDKAIKPGNTVNANVTRRVMNYGKTLLSQITIRYERPEATGTKPAAQTAGR